MSKDQIVARENAPRHDARRFRALLGPESVAENTIADMIIAAIRPA